MVSKCANPNCDARMKYLHNGRLFVVQTRSSARYWQKENCSFSAPPGNQIEYYWLCDSCVDDMTITAEGKLEYVTSIPKLSHIEAVDSYVMRITDIASGRLYRTNQEVRHGNQSANPDRESAAGPGFS